MQEIEIEVSSAVIESDKITPVLTSEARTEVILYINSMLVLNTGLCSFLVH